MPAMLGIVIVGLAIYGQRANPLFWLFSPLVALAWVCDVLLNQLLHLLLWDIKGYTITQRLKHYLQNDCGWRTDLALYLRAPINSLDEGHL
jgi:hypothetical protein